MVLSLLILCDRFGHRSIAYIGQVDVDNMTLDVGEGHVLHYETFGKITGIPILFLHGGPGLGCSAADRRFFDEDRHYVIFLDQRGSGCSTYTDILHCNEPDFLVSDILVLLDHLSISTIHLFGGSWGATLALLFASRHPNRVRSLIIRGLLTGTYRTIDIFTKGNLPDDLIPYWTQLLKTIPDEIDDVLGYSLETLTSRSANWRSIDGAWSRYGASLSRKNISKVTLYSMDFVTKGDAPQNLVLMHYAANRFFMEDGKLLESMHSVTSSTHIVHGRYDHLCPLWEIEKMVSTMSNADLTIVDGGHSASEPEVEQALMILVASIS